MFIAWLPVLLWMGVIFIGSTDVLSSRQTSRFIGPLLRWFQPDVTENQIKFVQMIVRKTGHVTEYAILAILLLRALMPASRPRGGCPSGHHLVFALGIATAYAVSDEIHQSFVATRQGSGWDVLIDAVGAAVGLVAWNEWCRFRHAKGVKAEPG